MKFKTTRSRQSGIALIVVMIAVTVLSILAAAFAYSMKVETKLAQNANSETELIWLGRSGVEYARWILAETLKCPYDSLHQKWAGGPGSMCETNGVLANISLRDYRLGDGKFSVTITDLERKYNINIADQVALEQALRLVGVDAGDSAAISGSILDWIDQDSNTKIGGTETSYYESLNPPYEAKNQPLDDLSELLLVRGVTPEIYWGGAATNHSLAAFQNRQGRRGAGLNMNSYGIGLAELFTPLSNGRININTASQTTLQMIPFVDPEIAARIIEFRSGFDGAEGTEDDTPAESPAAIGGLLLSAGLNQQLVAMAAGRCTVRSSTFEVRVDAEVAGYQRQFFGILGRGASPRDVPVLSFFWK